MFWIKFGKQYVAEKYFLNSTGSVRFRYLGIIGNWCLLKDRRSFPKTVKYNDENNLSWSEDNDDDLAWPDKEEKERNKNIPKNEWVQVIPPIITQTELDEFRKAHEFKS